MGGVRSRSSSFFCLMFEPTAGRVAFSDRVKVRNLGPAPVKDVGAAVRESTPREDAGGLGRGAGDGHGFFRGPAGAEAGAGRGSEKTLGVGVKGALENVVDIRGFHHPPRRRGRRP